MLALTRSYVHMDVKKLAKMKLTLSQHNSPFSLFVEEGSNLKSQIVISS